MENKIEEVTVNQLAELIKERADLEKCKSSTDIRYIFLFDLPPQICGKMAEEILNRIAKRNGELTKDTVIDWDKEVNEFITEELLIKCNVADKIKNV